MKLCDRLVETFGILLAGMMEAEKRTAPEPARPRPEQREASGVFVLPREPDAPEAMPELS